MSPLVIGGHCPSRKRPVAIHYQLVGLSNKYTIHHHPLNTSTQIMYTKYDALSSTSFNYLGYIVVIVVVVYVRLLSSALTLDKLF